MKQTLAFGCLLSAAAFAFAQPSGIQFATQPSWAATLQAAQTSGKIIFLDAYTTWCGPCKKMDKEVFNTTEVGTFYNEHFINVKMDMEKGEGVELADRYGIQAYPTLLYVQPDGEIAHRIAGFQTTEQLLTLGKIAGDPSRRLAEMNSRYQSGDRDPDFLYHYTDARYQIYDRSHGEVAEAYLATQTDWSSEKNKAFIFKYIDRTDSKAFAYLLEHRAAFEAMHTAKAVNERVETLINTRLDQLLSSKNGEEVFAQADALMAMAYPDRKAPMSQSFRMTYYRNAGDREGFAGAAVRYVELMGENITAGELTGIAWTFYRVIDDKTLLNTALGWAKKAVKLEPSTESYDALASLYFKTGNRKKAKKYALTALHHAEAKGEDTASIRELLKLIGE